MATDIKNAQRIRLWDGTNDFGFASTHPVYTRIHDTVRELNIHAEDIALGAGASGLLLLGVRDDAGGTRVSADGDATALSINAAGELRVTSTGGGGGGTSAVDNSAFTFGTTAITPTGFVVDDVATNAVTENSVGNARMSANRIVLTHIADPTTDTQRLAIDANGSAQTRIHGSVDFTSANAADNPIFTQNVRTAITGEVHDYDEQAIASDATGNHDWTPASTGLVNSIIFSASGAGKLDVILDPTGANVTKTTIFLAGSQLTEQVFFDPPIEVSGVVLRLTKQNDDNQSMSLYSTIIGTDQ